MPKIKHIAIATQDSAKTAAFYKEVFGLREIAKLESANANGYFLSDGNVNMAILDFQNDDVAGERGKDYSGIHHIGFEVEDLEDVEKKLAANNSNPMDSVNKALGVGMGGPRHANVEIKYTGPNGEMIDVSAHGWVGTRGFD
ncbi:MAG: VOC family protein [Chloroflexota bacterium]|nr:VOC family protein [Chloroflexota bacterium]